MRGLALCLVVGALVVAGCGSNSHSANAPKSQNAAAQGSGSGQSAGVSAAGRMTPASLCASEGKAKLKKKCASGLGKINSGQVRSAAKACKGLPKKKTKGVKGKSPFAVCVSAAGRLMAANANANANSGGGNGSADSTGSSTDSSGDTSTDSTDNSSNDLVCTDANGNVVSVDDPNLEDCEVKGDASTASSDSTDTSTDSTDTSTDSTDTTDTTGG